MEAADNNYDKLMDMFADSQRTVERMRVELNLGTQLVQNLQEEKLHLLEELEGFSKEKLTSAQNEEHLAQLRQLSEPDFEELIVVRKTLLI